MVLEKWKIAVITVAAALVVTGIVLGVYFGTKSKSLKPCENADEDGLCPSGTYRHVC